MAFWDILTALFGNSDSNAIIKELTALSSVARECAEKLRPGIDMSLVEITHDEHRGDAALRRLSEEIRNSFLPRQTITGPDMTHLGDELDDMIDLMRDVARHVQTYKKFLPVLPDAAAQLIDIVIESASTLDLLVQQLANGRIDFARVDTLTQHIKALEKRADVIQNETEHAFVDAPSAGDFRAYLAETLLIDKLETITDHAKRCAIIIVSMARKEA